MLKTTKTKMLAVALAGVVVLGGVVYATTAWAAGGSAAAPAVASTVQTTNQAQLRASALEMLKDRMGITGPEAEKLADQMITAMQSANPNFDLQDMFNWCAGNGPSGTFGQGGTSGAGYGYRGMIGGTGYGYGGMMGGYGLR